jgi:hypothetical protein
MPSLVSTQVAVALTLIAVASPSRAAAPPPEVAALVERCVAAYGGAAALRSLVAVRQAGTVTSLLHPGQAGRLQRVAARGGRLRVEIAWSGEPEVRVVDGPTGWRGGAPVQGPPLSAMVLQAARFDLPLRLKEGLDRLEDRGVVEQDGKRLRALALEVAPGLVVEAGLDPATGRILRSRAATSSGPAIEFVTTYGDFRTVGGLLFAFREGNWANGASTGETVLTSVELLARLPEGAFRP